MNLFLKNSIIVLILFLSITACTQDDYLTDSGVAKAETELTAYDYLKAHKYQMFDTLITLIDHYDLKETINSSGTFFAPDDYSIKRFLEAKEKALNPGSPGEVPKTYTLDDLLNDPTITSHSILQYVFKEKILLNSATTAGTEYKTLADTLITVKRIKTDDKVYYEHSDTPVYFLYYCKDGKINEVCQTSDILTQNGNGTVLHVLNNSHVFNLFSKEVKK
ncbi:fasciclin domain-containing protein [Flavobacterium sp. 5]|uniref:fasciclin domain-containing protein n=1 Tax=Flavobacterium sp. 5 TaxID=2035199 RepID=UPI000CABBD1F|nr:fasciclin domain-containing protein [Flavobacterium sp. 5]PKB18983.1 fasciclin domain-containing protein [Flavobacterium sp. 5]